MIGLAALSVAAVLILAGPRLAARLFEQRAPSRTVAAFHLLALVGAAALPLVVLACLALLRPDHMHTRSCAPAALHAARWVAFGLVGAHVARFAWKISGLVRATRRVGRAAALSAGARIESTCDADILVLPTDRPVAYVTGGWTGDVVVSRGLLDLLDCREREAAIAHEVAHVRLRHHRLLFFAQAAGSAFALPSVRTAYVSLRRELEAIADDHAVARVGDRGLLARALAKMALAASEPAPAPALGNPEDLVYRIERLTAPRPRDDRRAVAAAAVAALGLSLVVAQCAAFHPQWLLASGVACVVGITWLGRRAIGRPALIPAEPPA